jgi:hypothetical protein
MSALRTSTAARRTLVVAFGLAALALAVVSITRDEADRTWEWRALFAVVALLWVAAIHATSNAAERRPPEGLDGRLLAARHRALRIGFTFLWAGGLATAGILSVDDLGVPLAPRAPTVLISLVLAGAAMPTMVLCWAAPERAPDRA